MSRKPSQAGVKHGQLGNGLTLPTEADTNPGASLGALVFEPVAAKEPTQCPANAAGWTNAVRFHQANGEGRCIIELPKSLAVL